MPVYNPGAWNDANGIQYNNNCYDYCRDQQTGNFTQPGQSVGWWLDVPPHCADVAAAAMWDGLVLSDRDSVCPAGHWKVALVIAPGPYVYDFHWYRQDDDGTWSHKPGQGTARNWDNAGNVINDPENAARGPYTEFCNYFCTGNDGVRTMEAMATSSTSNPILIQLLYSGRRNPQRPLDQRAVGEIAGRLRGLPERKDAPEGELGEPAGFIISNPAGGEIPREVRVFDGAITVKEGSEKAVIYSDEKGLEEWLKKFIAGELEALSQ